MDTRSYRVPQPKDSFRLVPDTETHNFGSPQGGSRGRASSLGWPLLLVLLVGTGCDDTRQAIEEESRETQQELEQATEEAKAEAEREANQAKKDVKAATTEAERQLNKAADAVKNKMDEVDKAVADTIRDDDRDSTDKEE